MDLEAIERKCLTYLNQVPHPLVPFDALLAHLRTESELANLSVKELLDFLSNHELFRVIEPRNDPLSRQLEEVVRSSGLNGGPYVILSTRVPTDSDTVALMRQQITMITSALDSALQIAERKGRVSDVPKLQEMLARAHRLHAQLDRWS